MALKTTQLVLFFLLLCFFSAATLAQELPNGEDGPKYDYKMDAVEAPPMPDSLKTKEPEAIEPKQSRKHKFVEPDLKDVPVIPSQPVEPELQKRIDGKVPHEPKQGPKNPEIPKSPEAPEPKIVIVDPKSPKPQDFLAMYGSKTRFSKEIKAALTEMKQDNKKEIEILKRMQDKDKKDLELLQKKRMESEKKEQKKLEKIQTEVEELKYKKLVAERKRIEAEKNNEIRKQEKETQKAAEIKRKIEVLKQKEQEILKKEEEKQKKEREMIEKKKKEMKEIQEKLTEHIRKEAYLKELKKKELLQLEIEKERQKIYQEHLKELEKNQKKGESTTPAKPPVPEKKPEVPKPKPIVPETPKPKPVVVNPNPIPIIPVPNKPNNQIGQIAQSDVDKKKQIDSKPSAAPQLPAKGEKKFFILAWWDTFLSWFGAGSNINRVPNNPSRATGDQKPQRSRKQEVHVFKFWNNDKFSKFSQYYEFKKIGNWGKCWFQRNNKYYLKKDCSNASFDQTFAHWKLKPFTQESLKKDKCLKFDKKTKKTYVRQSCRTEMIKKQYCKLFN